MASGAVVSGLDRLVEAVEAAEAAAATAASHLAARRRRDGFRCPHPGCERLFSKRYNQQAHMRIHDGTRPFSCELCGKAFMWKSSLKSHGKMHAKMSAAEAAAGDGSRSSTSVHRSSSPSRPLTGGTAGKSSRPAVGVAKKRSNSSSPTRKGVQSGATKVPSSAGVTIVSPCGASTAPTASWNVPRMDSNKRQYKEKSSTGWQSPNSVSRMDLETATLLTMFR